MKQKIYYTTYETTDIINNKYYIGCHKTKDINDNYLGSGIIIKNKIKKYGKEYFTKLITGVWRNAKIMYLMENWIVDKDIVNNDDYYNISCGGCGPIKTKDIIKKKMTYKINSKFQISQATKNTLWYNNEIIQTRVKILNIKRIENLISLGYKQGKIDSNKYNHNITIYNNENNIYCYTEKSFTKMCKDYNIPEGLFKRSYLDGAPIKLELYRGKKKIKNPLTAKVNLVKIPWIGWRAVKIYL